MVAHIGERQNLDPTRRVAWPHFARRRHRHVGVRPAAHTRLGEGLVIVGEHPDDLEPIPEPPSFPLYHFPPSGELCLRRHQCGAVVQRPTIELRVGEPDPLGAESLRKPDQRLDLMQVLAAQHHVDRQREAQLASGTVRGQLVVVRGGSGDPIGEVRVGCLNADLHVIESRIFQLGEALPGETIRRGHEHRVETELLGAAHQLDEIGPQCRLPTREPELHDAQVVHLPKNAAPFFGRQLAPEAPAGEIQRVRAIRAL